MILAARPSMGKTALAINMAEHAVMSPGDGAVLFFSMEMPADAIVMRMLSSLGRIDQTRMRTGDLQDDDWPRFTSAVSQLKDKKLLELSFSRICMTPSKPKYLVIPAPIKIMIIAP